MIHLIILLCSFVLSLQATETDIQQIAREIASTILKSDTVTLAPLTGGARAQVFKASATCVVRCIPSGNPLEARKREIAVAQYADAIGIGPRVLYANAETGLMVMETLDILKAPQHMFDTPEWNYQLGKTIRMLHNAVNHDIELPCNGTCISDIDSARFSHENITLLHDILSKEHIELILKECKDLYPYFTQSYVCSHGDLHENNLLYTSKGFRIIDYEFVSRDSMYVDLSRIAVAHSSCVEHDYALLEGYFGRIPTQYELACFSIMKHVMYLREGLIYVTFYSKDLITQYLYTNESVRYLSTAYKHGDFYLRTNHDMVRRTLAYIREAAWYFGSNDYEKDKNLIIAPQLFEKKQNLKIC